MHFVMRFGTAVLALSPLDGEDGDDEVRPSIDFGGDILLVVDRAFRIIGCNLGEGGVLRYDIVLLIEGLNFP